MIRQKMSSLVCLKWWIIQSSKMTIYHNMKNRVWDWKKYKVIRRMWYKIAISNLINSNLKLKVNLLKEIECRKNYNKMNKLMKLFQLMMKEKLIYLNRSYVTFALVKKLKVKKIRIHWSRFVIAKVNQVSGI